MKSYDDTFQPALRIPRLLIYLQTELFVDKQPFTASYRFGYKLQLKSFNRLFICLTTADSYREKWPDLAGTLSRKLKKLCSVEGLYQRVPITQWLPKYRRSYILEDVVAGLTVALTVIPQGIADAALAGLPPQYGLYSSFMGRGASTENYIFNILTFITELQAVSFTAFSGAAKTSQSVCSCHHSKLYKSFRIFMFELQVQQRFCRFCRTH